MSIRPLQGYCLVQVLPDDTMTASGLHLPELSDNPTPEQIKKRGPLKARVLEIGKWPQTSNGLSRLPHFFKGSTVLVSEYSGTKLNRSIGTKLKLVKQDDVLAVLSED